MDIRRYKWRSTLNRQREDFSKILRRDSLRREFFNDDYAKKVSARYDQLDKKNNKVLGIYYVLMLILFFSQTQVNSEVRIFGFKLANLSEYSEVLLAFASILYLFSGILETHTSRLKMIMEEYIKAKCPDSSVRNYYSEVFESSLFPPLTKPRIDKYVVDSHAALFIKSVFILIAFVLFFMLFVAQVYIQAFVVLDVIENPKLDETLSNYLIFISVASLLASYILVILRLPLPEKNYSFYKELLKLKEKDTQEWARKIKEIVERKNFYTNSTLLVFGFLYFNAFCYFYGDYKTLINSDDITRFVVTGTIYSFVYLFFLLESYRIMTILEGKFLVYSSGKFKESQKIHLRNITLASYFKKIALILFIILLALYLS